MNLVAGMLVTHRDVAGILRIAEIDGVEALVEQFDSPALPVADTRRVRLVELRRRTVEAQSRVFWYDSIAERWVTGRVVGGGPNEYYVRAANSAYDLRIPESDLRVRWSRPLLDPIGVLLAGGQESPFYRDSRLPVMQAIAAQRSASASVGALTSSRIQLHAHQVDTALQILSDPVQRYLLADEVGLGKTIEAGLVIRQLLIENPVAKVVVIAPSALCGQWDSELETRFFIDDFPASTIVLASHRTPERWRRHVDADLVVVDEAHRLVSEEDPWDGSYQDLKGLALAVPRLLLLSATPVLRREVTHLALLHLLDPSVYLLDKIDEFRAKIAIRKELASAVLQLDPEFSYLLEEAIEHLRELLPPDDRFELLSARVLEFLNDDGDLLAGLRESAFVASVAAVRAYVAETYRLHRRVIRSRRRAVLQAPLDDAGITPPFEVTGRARPRLIAATSYEATVGREALDEWRRGCRDYLMDTEGDPGSFASSLAVLISRSGGPLSDLRDALAWRVDRDDTAARRAGLTEAELRELTRAPVLAVEHEILSNLRDHQSGEAIVDLAARLVTRANEVRRLVVFAGRGQLADALAEALRSRGLPSVCRHTEANGVRQSAEELARWRATGGVLVCDATADDGLNLQDANAVVHTRLPASPNDLEQRIGRVDRYGSAATAAQYVVGDRRDAGLSGAWLGVLLDGYRVFEESVSAYQDAIDQGLDDVWRRAFEDGVDGLLSRIPPIRSAMDDEAKSIAQFEALESSYAHSRGARDVAAALAELESDDRHGQAVRRLLEGRDAFGFVVHEDRRGLHVSYGDRRPLLGSDLLKEFVGLAPGSFDGHLDRWRALREGGRLLAAGNPLVDALWNVLLLDDRGRVTAQWRVDPRWQSDPLPYFGFDYLLQADLTHATEIVHQGEKIEPGTLRRRADRYFAPVYRRIWLSGDTLTPVIDPDLLGWLHAPYRHNAGDVNLNSERIPALHRLFGGPGPYVVAARDAEAAARDELRRATDLAARIDTAIAALGEEHEVLAAQAAARSRADELLVDDGGARLDEQLSAALARGIEEPSLQLLAVSCMVRSATRWDSG